jgi:hypothetical protein
MRSIVVPVLAASLAFASLSARAEFLDPDLSLLQIESVGPPDWIAGFKDDRYIGLCLTCDGTVTLQVQVLDDDGTGERVRSGETTAETYTALGKENAAQLGGEAAYVSTEPVNFASAVGFRTKAITGAGDFSVTYQLWSDGKQLVAKVYGPDESVVASLAEKVYRAAAPLTFR